MNPLRTATATLVALATAGAALAWPASPALAADPVVHSASGLSIRDLDGGTLQAPTAPVGWSAGVETAAEVAGTATPAALRSGYVLTTSGTRTVAGPNGARTTVDEARLELRGRVPLTLRGLTVGCAPGGRSLVTVDRLVVGDVDRTAAAQQSPGTTIALPATPGAYDDDATITLEAVATTASTRTVTGLRITNGDNYEVRDLSLGQVSCTDAAVQPAREPHRVAGVQVVGADGVRLVEPSPVLTGPGAGTAAADEVRASGVRSRASGVRAAAAADGSVDVVVEAFAQLPDEDALAEFRPSALRVNHLRLHVAPSGASSVTFDDPVNALFADGRWLNHQDGYIYSKVDEEGDVLLEVRVNERIEHGDGTTTVNALHYVDHTGAWPEVVLGQVVVGADDGPGTGPAPQPEPEAVVPPGTWHAYGVRATGAIALDATALSTLATRESSRPDAADSTGQVRAGGLRTRVGGDGASSEVATLDLFPGTDAAVHLRDLRTTVTSAGTSVTTGGGTVLGHPVAAGPVVPGATYRLDGTSTTVVLGARAADATGLPVTHGLLLTSPDELATTVSAASVAVGPLAVPAATATTVSATARPTSYGDRAVLRVRTTGADAGTVTVTERGRTLATAAVRDGSASIRLPRRLGAGTHRLAVALSAPGAAASSTTVRLRVSQARPRVAVATSGRILRVRVTGLPVRPRGLTVQVYDGRRRLTRSRVTGATTRVVLPRGHDRVRVVLPATADTTRVARTVTLR